MPVIQSISLAGGVLVMQFGPRFSTGSGMICDSAKWLQVASSDGTGVGEPGYEHCQFHSGLCGSPISPRLSGIKSHGLPDGQTELWSKTAVTFAVEWSPVKVHTRFVAPLHRSPDQ